MFSLVSNSVCNKILFPNKITYNILKGPSLGRFLLYRTQTRYMNRPSTLRTFVARFLKYRHTNKSCSDSYVGSASDIYFRSVVPPKGAFSIE